MSRHLRCSQNKTKYNIWLIRINARDISVPVCDQCTLAPLHQVDIEHRNVSSHIVFNILRRVSLITLLRTKAVKYLCCSLVDTQGWQHYSWGKMLIQFWSFKNTFINIKISIYLIPVLTLIRLITPKFLPWATHL